MSPSSVAGVITAIATVLIALGGLVSAVSLLIPILRQTRAVHTIVNQQRTNTLNYNRALQRALKEHGIDIPIDQSADEG